MKIGYYPGCTLKAKAKNLEDSAVAAMEALEIGRITSNPTVWFWDLMTLIG